MAYTPLRTQSIANPDSTGPAFVVTRDFYDSILRKPYSTQQDSDTAETFELATGAEVGVIEYAPGKTHVVRYNGNGSVYTSPGTTSTTCLLTPLATPTETFTSAPGAGDACFDLTGTLGAPPYAVQLTGPSYSQSAVSRSEVYPVRFYNLSEGSYTFTVTDALGCVATQTLTILAGLGTTGRGTDLRDTYTGDPTTGTGTRLVWINNSHELVTYTYTGGGQDGDLYQRPYGDLVDGYLLDDGVTWRRVYSDGDAGVYFVDEGTGTVSSLDLDNLILFNPDTPAATGGVLVEVIASAPPLTFTLNGVSNSTGRFDGLVAGSYVVNVTDSAGASLAVPFALTALYGKWRQLEYDNLYGVPLRLECWLRQYTGTVGTVCGQGEPVVLAWDGLNSSVGGQGDLPPVVGRSATLNLLVEPDLFEQVETAEDDRYCRVDFYYDNQLEFRGYVQPDIYNSPLLDGKQPITVTATDGLASLKDAYMEGHEGQRLNGHRPWLHTILHCLSRCDVSLPLRVYTNRRDAAMNDSDAPELAATSNRTGYWDEDKNEPIFQRQTLEAVVQAAGGTLCQRGGAWEVRSALEAAQDAPGRAYLPAGSAVVAVTAGAPTATVRAPLLGPLFWVNASQQKQVRAGWKSLTGTTDAGWLKNAFIAGEVFSDPYAWLEDGSRLRPIGGWHPAPGQSFPLVLVRSGEKGTDHTTEWLRSGGVNMPDNSYLESPVLPLAVGYESVPAILNFTGKLVPTEYYSLYAGGTAASPTTATKALLPYEIIIDGRGTGIRTAEIVAASSSSGKDTTFSVPLDAMPTGSKAATLRVYSWYALDNLLLAGLAPVFVFLSAYKQGDVVRYAPSGGAYRLFVNRRGYGAGISTTPFDNVEWAEITATNTGQGQLLISSVGVELRPQGATWDGEDNFRADGPAGNIRPTEALEVFHPDVPLGAGLFGNNLLAFGKAVALADGTMSTSWKRRIDLLPSPLFEADVLDSLALRARPSRLLTGDLRHQGVPPRLLDSLDLPTDVPGRRFLVGSASWNTKAAETTVSLLEIGAGADAPDPLAALPDRLRVTHEVYPYAPTRYTKRVRGVHGGGVRVVH